MSVATANVMVDKPAECLKIQDTSIICLWILYTCSEINF